MIVDKLSNIMNCFKENTLLAKAAEFAQAFDPESPAGTYEVDGKNIYAIYAHSLTKDVKDCLFETHRKYIDIQVLYSGALIMGHSFGREVKSATEYDAERDLQMFEQPEAFTKVVMSDGEFAVFFPHDYHMPDCSVSKPSSIKKLILKIRA